MSSHEGVNQGVNWMVGWKYMTASWTAARQGFVGFFHYSLSGCTQVSSHYCKTHFRVHCKHLSQDYVDGHVVNAVFGL